jgi:hypothetical protein
MSTVQSKWIGRGKTAEASVILRRQVPIRFDEPARSWLGGLPQMPDNIRWPRTASNGAPLHFIAQIACADLPKQIWNGRGPRDGWLLLFVDVLQMEDSSEEEEDIDDLSDLFWLAWRRAAGWLGRFAPGNFGRGGLVQVLHIDRLGTERQPPEDMTTVRHAMGDYIGRFKPEVRDGVPKLWRCWPVDLVVQEVPPPPPEDSGTEWEPLQVTGADLYGAPEDDEHIDQFAEAQLRPLTWRGALYLIEALMRKFSKDEYEHNFRHNSGGLAEVPVWEPGWLAKAIANLEAALVQNVASLAEATTNLQLRSLEAALVQSMASLAEAAPNLQLPSPELSPKERAMSEDHLRSMRDWNSAAERTLADLALFSEPAREDALAAEIGRVGEAHMSWVERQRSELERTHRHILTQDLDALIGDENWAAMKAEMIAAETEYWTWSWSSEPLDLRKTWATMFDFSNTGLQLALREDVLDLYTRDAAARAVIPPAILAEIEPKLRNIGISRAPHRMGGPRDVLQGYASRADDDLLFQIFSDDAMGWMWGDLGALFIYLKPSDLKARRFKRIYAWIDGH